MHVLFSLECCAYVWMSSLESYLGLLDSVVRSANGLYEGELCCLAHRKKVSALCLLYKICHRVDHPMNGYLNNVLAAHNTKASDALGELVLVVPRSRTDQLSRSFLPAAVRLWNLLPSNMFSDGTLSSFSSDHMPTESLA